MILDKSALASRRAHPVCPKCQTPQVRKWRYKAADGSEWTQDLRMCSEADYADLISVDLVWVCAQPNKCS